MRGGNAGALPSSCITFRTFPTTLPPMPVGGERMKEGATRKKERGGPGLEKKAVITHKSVAHHWSPGSLAASMTTKEKKKKKKGKPAIAS